MSTSDLWTRVLAKEMRPRQKNTHPLNEPPRSFTTTLAPRAPKNAAYAFPNPPLAPVTMTVCPSNLNSDILIVQYGGSVYGGTKRERRELRWRSEAKRKSPVLEPRHGVNAPPFGFRLRGLHYTYLLGSALH